MILRTWGARHNIPFAAILELEQMLGLAGREAMRETGVVGEQGSESRQSSLVRLEAAESGVMLTRNNVGALRDERGIPVRFGLFNESAKQNKRIKSSDLVGWRPVVIHAGHVGRKFALFTMREVKEEGWQFDPKDEHQAAQKVCIDLVLADGGDAAFATGPGSFFNI